MKIGNWKRRSGATNGVIGEGGLQSSLFPSIDKWTTDTVDEFLDEKLAK